MDIIERIKKCPEFQTCPKIDMLCDKDILDFQLREAVISVCTKCLEEKDKTDLIS